MKNCMNITECIFLLSNMDGWRNAMLHHILMVATLTLSHKRKKQQPIYDECCHFVFYVHKTRPWFTPSDWPDIWNKILGHLKLRTTSHYIPNSKLYWIFKNLVGGELKIRIWELHNTFHIQSPTSLQNA